MKNPTTVRFNTYNTRRNLPPETGRKRGEANFLGAFERYLLSNIFTTGYGGKYFSLSDYGIADFIWLLPSNKKGTLHAFETKLKDWRKALQQAYKYSYYSDESYVVLPPNSGEIARRYLHLFKINNIGLWTYNPKDNYICRIFTPINPAPRNPEAKSKAVNIISSRIQLGKRTKTSNAFAQCIKMF